MLPNFGSPAFATTLAYALMLGLQAPTWIGTTWSEAMHLGAILTLPQMLSVNLNDSRNCGVLCCVNLLIFLALL